VDHFAGRRRWARKPPRRLTAEELAEALTFLDSHDRVDDALSLALANELARRMAARRLLNGNGRGGLSGR
jgi:hypothetical protein